MRSVFAALFLLVAGDVAMACPPALSSAQLQAMESTEDASTYVLLRRRQSRWTGRRHIGGGKQKQRCKY